MFTLVLLSTILASVLSAHLRGAQDLSVAPNVSVLEVQLNYVTLEVIGPVSFNGSNVATIHIHVTNLDKKIDFGNNGHLGKVHVQSFGGNVFKQRFNVTGLEPGAKERLSVTLVNRDGHKSAPSETTVVLLPPAPSVDVTHVGENKLILKWNGSPGGHEDYFIIQYSKGSLNPGCGATLNLTTCFTKQYSFADLEHNTVYYFTIRSHNPSGFSEEVLLKYPIE